LLQFSHPYTLIGYRSQKLVSHRHPVFEPRILTMPSPLAGGNRLATFNIVSDEAKLPDISVVTDDMKCTRKLLYLNCALLLTLILI